MKCVEIDDKTNIVCTKYTRTPSAHHDFRRACNTTLTIIPSSTQIDTTDVRNGMDKSIYRFDKQ